MRRTEEEKKRGGERGGREEVKQGEQEESEGGGGGSAESWPSRLEVRIAGLRGAQRGGLAGGPSGGARSAPRWETPRWWPHGGAAAHQKVVSVFLLSWPGDERRIASRHCGGELGARARLG